MSHRRRYAEHHAWMMLQQKKKTKLWVCALEKIFSRIGHTLKWRQQNRRRNVFIDCGGHKGQSIEKFKRSKQYRDSKFEIFSFEPNFDLIQNYAKY